VDQVLQVASTWVKSTWSSAVLLPGITERAPPAGQYDFESVMLHEMGHGHQLNHSIDATAVMHYSISSGTFKRTLNANEIAGAIFIKNRDIGIGTVCGSALPMTVLACNSGTAAAVGDFYRQ
jgi:hypothetical protein